MPLSAPEYWFEWTKNYFRCQFTHVGELIHKETWSAASFGWAEGLQRINPPIYRLTTAVSDIDQTNINRDIRDGNWLSNKNGPKLPQNGQKWPKKDPKIARNDLNGLKVTSETISMEILPLLRLFWVVTWLVCDKFKFGDKNGPKIAPKWPKMAENCPKRPKMIKRSKKD